ncbi:hypothetical protein GGR52DRAFT_432411 [Hypoxylon sp. FL1284]|nr:hypothetical protein GGR52DRAFT_432411 [Hypoxylon sp. FL1284]
MALTRPTAAPREVFGDRLSELTTVFSPPCPTTWLLTTTKVPSQYPAFPTTGPESCDPPNWTRNLAQKGFAYYSPAICPSGFTAGCTISNPRTGEGFPPLTAQETAMYCVPSGFTCTSDTTDFRGGVWGYLRTDTASKGSVTVGPAIQIRWQEKDLIDLATDPLNPDSFPTKTPESPIATITAQVPEIAPSKSTQTPTTSPEPTLESQPSPIPVPDLMDSTTFSTALTTTETLASTSPSPVQSSPGPDQSGGTPAVSNGDTSGSSGADQGASTASSTSIAAMSLSAVLIFMILTSLAVGAVRRYRRYRAGEVKAFFPPGLGEFFRKFITKPSSRPPSECVAASQSSKSLEAELDTEGPISELGPGVPLGMKDNPAELGESGVRNSWMSHVSRMFTVRMRKDVSSV